ncbi:MAG TPA: hypothetical protein VLA99_10770 [Nitrospiraceae bacterium]|nr:hypothetical protein [Nitrospiraceae bacterium]
MVEMIGIVTLCTLVWVLASSMARESDAEKRRTAMPPRHGLPDVAEKVREAA